MRGSFIVVVALLVGAVGAPGQQPPAQQQQAQPPEIQAPQAPQPDQPQAQNEAQPPAQGQAEPAAAQPPQAQPQAQQPAAPPQAPQQTAAQPQQDAQATPAPQAPATVVPAGTMNLNNASLTEVVDILCRALRINYIIDPGVTGSVSINTYGETQNLDARSLLEVILRINGATMVQVGDIYRIVPLADAQRLPIPVTSDLNDLRVDDSTVLALVFLKYAIVSEVVTLLEPFIGPGAQIVAYPPANLMFVLDSRRNVRRVLDLIGMFDSDTLANQRVRVFDLTYSSPSDMANELSEILKSISLSEENSLVRFLPIDRLNILVAVAPNPGAFEEVENWIRRLDVEPKTTAGGVSNYVYRVRYSQPTVLASVITMLYGGYPSYGYGYGGGAGGYGYGGGGGFGGGGFGGGGFGGGGFGGGGFGGGGFGVPGFTQGMGGLGVPGAQGNFGAGQVGGVPGALNQGGQIVSGLGAGGVGQTGQYLGLAPGVDQRIPRIIPNPIDSTLLIQCTSSEWQQIQQLLREIDVPPRQVLIEAKIYEVSLTGAFSAGVSAALQTRTSGQNRQLRGSYTAEGVNLTAGMLFNRARDLMGMLELAEVQRQSRIISSPSIIATDSIAASINVGVDVPVLASQAVAGGVQVGGDTAFANTISSRSTGVNLNITARVTPSGVVTLFINQEVSAPQAPPVGAIQSPSFSKRAVNTQVTVQDGDTIAIGGIISESNGRTTAGIPVLHKLPFVGWAFGAVSTNSERTETVIFMTPRVIYDTNQIQEASDDITTQFRRLQKIIRQ